VGNARQVDKKTIRLEGIFRMAKTQKLNLIQTCRGFAAISVLLLHLTSKLYDKYTPGYKFLNGFFMHGGSGVGFLFCTQWFHYFL